jgi:hypothetical protein
MPRPRLLCFLLFAAVLAPVLSPRPGWSVQGAAALEQLAARDKALQERRDADRTGTAISEAEIRDLESGFISLLRQDPEDRTVATQLATFHSRWYGFLSAPAPELLDLVRTSHVSTGIVQLLTEQVGEGSHPFHAQIALAALAGRPADPWLWDLAASVAPEPWKIPFQEEAFRARLTTSSTPGDAPAGTPSAPNLAARWITRLLAAGLLHPAVAAYLGLAPEVRAPIDDDTAIPGGLFTSYSDERRDLRLEIAAAAFLDGDRETAGRLLRLATEKAAVRRPVRESEPDSLLLMRRLVERALAAPEDDGFDLLIQSSSDMLMGDPTLVQLLLNARLAEREAYPALAAYELGSFHEPESEPFEPEPDVPARVRARKDAITAEEAALARSLEDEAQADEAAASTALGPDPATPRIARLLAAPAAPLFAEGRLPQGIKPVVVSDQQIEARVKAAAQRVHLPSSFNVVRIDWKGQQVAAIVVSQALDPVGELSSGGYWVLLSRDGGATWGAPLYTGLRLNQPYVVRPLSALPMFDGDHLRVEVEIRELDPESIIFPPIGLAPKRVEKGLFLDLPLAALARDSDGDGLTDIIETRLLTDPQTAHGSAVAPAVRRQLGGHGGPGGRGGKDRRRRGRDHPGSRRNAGQRHLLRSAERTTRHRADRLLHRRAPPLRRPAPGPAPRRSDPRRGGHRREDLRPLLSSAPRSLPVRPHRPPCLRHLVRLVARRRPPPRREGWKMDRGRGVGMDHVG